MKKFKGFTLVELIIVMAILVILMASIMSMMKPIRATYLDSTYYEAQRNTQSGIVKYITESTRYATNLGIYTEGTGGITTAVGAITEFKTATGLTDDSTINVITIDNKTAYTYNGSDFYGRIIRSKPAPASGSFTNNVAKASTTEGRLALGSAYYGAQTYSINFIPNDVTTPTGVKLSVASILPSSLVDNKNVTTNQVTSNKNVLTESEIICKNLLAPISGKFDITKAGTTTATQGVNTYIVFTLPQ